MTPTPPHQNGEEPDSIWPNFALGLDVERGLDGAIELGAHAARRREPVDDAAVTADQDLVEVPGRHPERAGLSGSPAIERMCLVARHDLLVGERKGHVEIGLAEF